MNMRNFRKWSWEMFIKYDTNVTFEQLHRMGEIYMKEKKISYLISFKDEDQREEFKKLLGIVRYKSNLEVAEAVLKVLRSYEKGLK